ncbi:hypothetical protein CVIRNUC_009243 [Coccomyxa viridis]|uniref:Amino acid transporter transmembrane domain-containing protein n=1 Tax=Coccomyxa viridis TaxID=1274662 RepID=A0AAV1III4_9CHLO|nr:hypothetical protein CVIRNUC_009243 [Coccomyxa viridis]
MPTKEQREATPDDKSLSQSRERLLGDSSRADEDVQDVEAPPEQNATSAAGVSVVLTTAIMLGDMLGLGSLTLPSVFARLGWIPAILVVLLCGLGTVWAGRLFALLAVKVTRARVFDDFGGAALGNWGRRAVYVTVYATILAEPIIFHLTSMEALQQIFYSAGLTQKFAALLVTAVMVPLAQIQGIEEVSAISVIGTIGMAWALGVIAVKLCITPKVAGYAHTRLFPQLHSFGDVPELLVAVFDTVFTFGGQVNWLRYLMSMQQKRKFPLAVANVSAVMEVAYLMIGCVGYYRLGSDFDKSKPVTSVLPQDIWTSLANVGLLAHCIIAYMINLNVWTHLVLHLIAPSKQREEDGEEKSSRPAWAVTSVIGIALSCVVSVTVPFFDIIVAAIGALGDLAAAYALPALFVLVLMGSQLPRWERMLCYVVIPVTLLLSVVGVGSSVAALVRQVRQR